MTSGGSVTIDGKGHSPFRFIARFALLYVLFEALYFLIPNDFLIDVLYRQGIVGPGATVINLVSPEQNVSPEANRLVSPRAILEIIRGCDGSGTLFLLLAAVLAYPASWRLRAVGLLAGIVLVYVVNQVRIIGLYFVVAYHEAWFLPIHTYYAPTLIVVICGLFFTCWVWLADSRQSEANGQPVSA